MPASPADIPKHVPYLLIGGGTASFAAFRAIKSADPKAKVLVVTDETEMPYMRPPLSKEMWLSASSGGNATDSPAAEQLNFKQWNGKERSLFFEPADFYLDPARLMEATNGGVAIVRGYTVRHIDVCTRNAVLSDGTEIRYDECLLATGSQPRNLDVFAAAPQAIRERVSRGVVARRLFHFSSIHYINVILFSASPPSRSACSRRWRTSSGCAARWTASKRWP